MSTRIESVLAAEFPLEAFRYRVATFGDGMCSVPASLLSRALAAYSNEKTKRQIVEDALEVMRRENQMLWTAIANRDEVAK